MIPAICCGMSQADTTAAALALLAVGMVVALWFVVEIIVAAVREALSSPEDDREGSWCGPHCRCRGGGE